MLILVFDTCLNKTYITLSDDKDVLDTKIISSTDENYHSAFLIPEITNILKKNKITMQDIQAVGTNIGPGSFTGIRSCTTIARVFAQQLGIKLVGITSLQILSMINISEKKSLVILDARKNKIYYGIYDAGGKIVQPACILEKEDIFELAKGDYCIITDTSINEYLANNQIESINYENINYNLGEYLCRLTYNEVTQKQNYDFSWAKVKPLYIQPPSISKPKTV